MKAKGFRSPPADFLVALLIMAVFNMAFVNDLFSGLGAVLFIITALLVHTSFAAARDSGVARPYFVLSILVTITGYSLAKTVGSNGTPEGLANASRFFVLFPAALIAGWAIASCYGVRRFGFIYTVLAVPLSVLATLEALRGSSLFGRTAAFSRLERDGQFRALLGSEHALVLGVLIAAAIPWLLEWRRPRSRTAGAVIYLVGIWSTDSRGAFGLGLVAAILVCFPGIVDQVRKFRWPLLAVPTVAVAWFLYEMLWVWQPVTTSTDWRANSFQYRGAMYALLPDILANVPSGYGSGSLPRNVWLVVSPMGATDVAHSVDSQLVLSALRFGWIGVTAYVALTAFATWGVTRLPSAYGSLAIIQFSGMFLALDAWTGLGTVWMLLLGICLFDAFARDRPPPQRLRPRPGRDPRSQRGDTVRRSPSAGLTRFEDAPSSIHLL